MRKHQYVDDRTDEIIVGNNIYEIHFQKCIYCNNIAGLDEGDIQAMPTSMAKCKESPVKAGLMELLRSKVDCRGY